jgi:hypothetical protein
MWICLSSSSWLTRCSFESKRILVEDGCKFSESFGCWFSGDITYVNLLLNPEKFTGYSGVSAHKIWEAIYMQNCFKGGFLMFPHKYQDVSWIHGFWPVQIMQQCPLLQWPAFDCLETVHFTCVYLVFWVGNVVSFIQASWSGSHHLHVWMFYRLGLLEKTVQCRFWVIQLLCLSENCG